MGGVDVDLNSRTSMNHLYASGETCCNGVHGANRLASNYTSGKSCFSQKSAAMHISSSPSLGSQRFSKNIGMPLESLSEIYNLTLTEYEDTQKYTENNKKQILEAIRKDKKESA